MALWGPFTGMNVLVMVTNYLLCRDHAYRPFGLKFRIIKYSQVRMRIQGNFISTCRSLHDAIWKYYR
jgi:hypothetical protein